MASETQTQFYFRTHPSCRAGHGRGLPPLLDQASRTGYGDVHFAPTSETGFCIAVFYPPNSGQRQPAAELEL